MSLEKFPSSFLNFSDGNMAGENGNSYRFGRFTLDLSEHRLLDVETPVPLTPKAFEVLCALIQRAGHLVEKDELMDRVWPDSFVEEINVARIVHTLRKALGDDGNGNKFIETIPKKGYRFVAEVVSDELTERNYLIENGAGLPTGWQSPEQAEETKRWSWKHYATVATIFAAAAVLVLGSYRYFSQPAVTAVDDRRTIAVLPLDNSTGDPDQAYLVDGITENIINNLSELSSLRVIPRDSVFHYKGMEIQPADVAQQLHADLLMKGDIKQVGNELIINVNLIDPKDGSLLWGKQFAQNALNIVATPNEITTAVVQRLELKLTAEESRRLSVLPTENSEAYQLYLKGQASGELQSPDGLQKSIELYRQAIEKDPNFALAYSEIGMRYVNLGIYYMSPDDTMEKARESAKKALLMDPSLHDPHIVLGLVALLYDWNWDKARDELIEGTSVNLKSIEAFNCSAHILQMAGETSDADAALRHALDEDPLNISLITELGCNSYYAGRYDESINEYRDSLALKPGNFMAVFGLARTLNKVGKYQEAVNELNSLRSIMPEIPEIGIAERAYANAKMGKRQDAETDLSVIEKASKERFVDPFLEAVVYLGMNEKELALNSLDRAVAVRSSLIPSLEKDAKWDPYRDDSHFKDILQKIGPKQTTTVTQ